MALKGNLKSALINTELAKLMTWSLPNLKSKNSVRHENRSRLVGKTRLDGAIGASCKNPVVLYNYCINTVIMSFELLKHGERF